MSRQPSTIRRIWLTIAPCAAPGRVGLKLSLMPPPDMTDCMAVLLTRGDLPPGWPLDLEIVSDPSADPSLKGPPGEPGQDGEDGLDGLSAYQLARQQGYGGTTTQWLASLVGTAGASAYDLARVAGYGGTVTQWLASLAGAPGKDGTNGTNGKDGTPASTLLGTLTISENIVAAISAGTRRLTLTTPASWGVAPGAGPDRQRRLAAECRLCAA